MDHVTDAGGIVELTQQRRQLANRHVFHAHHAGDDLVAFARIFTVGQRRTGGAGNARAHHFNHAVIHRDHRQAVQVQHAQEKLVIFVFRQHVIGSDRHRALHGRVDQNGFVQIAAYRINKFADIGVFKAGAKVGCEQRTGI